MLVILGHMQLLTENTITTVVPVALNPTRRTQRRRALRLGAAVLAANVVDAFLITGFFA